MHIFKVAGKFTILRGDKTVETKYRDELSKIIIEKNDHGPYSSVIVKDILMYSQLYYIEKFHQICQGELSYPFYKEVVWLHEQAAALRRSEAFKNLPEGLDTTYIVSYRRVLKMIMEEACLINLQTGEKKNKAFQNRIAAILDELFYLGTALFNLGESLAEEIMIEDCTDIYFDDKGLYTLGRRHHYGFAFDYVIKEIDKFTDKPVTDSNGKKDFIAAVMDCFKLDYEKLLDFIRYFMDQHELKWGDCISMGKNDLLKDLERWCELPATAVDIFLSGLILSRENKMPLADLVKRPHEVNRCLSRPVLLWTINGKEFCVFGRYGFDESENHLILNSIPWGKMSEEWKSNKCFKAYMEGKKLAHDRWLDNEVEKRILKTGQRYDEHVTKLHTKNGYIPMQVDGLGEIDFIIISAITKKILIADCKHFQGRYDMTSYKIDYGYFVEKGTHGYNNRLKGKVEWMKNNITFIEEHFQFKYSDPSFKLDGYTVEGIFFINTPTFYMYNADFRIYTFDFVEAALKGEYKDPVMTYLVKEENSLSEYIIKYPYFRKPVLLELEDDDDGEVDIYGDPIEP